MLTGKKLKVRKYFLALLKLTDDFTEEFVMTIEAIDGGDPPLSSQATIIVNVSDVNDNAPVFKKRMYQGFMNGDLSNLRNDVQVC